MGLVLEVTDIPATISSPPPPLFSQVCNCDKYLKVPKERMRQLVEDSRHSLGDSSTGERAPRGGRAEICIPLLTRGCVHRISPR